MELIESKICAMISLGLGSMVVGLIPAWFSTQGRSKWPLLLSSLLCIGAGVLLSTSLVHMLPEVRESLAAYGKYAELIFCVGFFLLYITDEIVHCIKERSQHIHCVQNEDHFPIMGQNRSVPRFEKHNDYGSISHRSYDDSMTQRQMPFNPHFVRTRSESDVSHDIVPSQICHVAHQEPCDASHVGNLGLLIALTLHSLLEGVAVGVETSAAKVLLMLGAIASHKLVVGFCLGVEIASGPATNSCKHFVSIAIFSFGSVLGIGSGMAIAEIPKKLSELVLPVMQGLAGGTLLYVTLCEVLPRERARWHQNHRRTYAGVVQFLSVTAGFIAMTFLIMTLED